jgi:bla regulator protein BlaR1
MNMLFIHWLFNERLIKAICWALLHSLWQGLVFTIVAAIIILFTRRSSPVLRYNLFTALFGLFLVITGFTFMSQVSTTKKNQAPTFKISSAELTISNTGTGNAEPVKSVSTFHTIIDYCNTHASLIVATWFVLFSIKLTRMLANIGYIQRIRYYKAFEPPSYWKQRITELSKSLHIEYDIMLLESAIIKVPMVLGILKPVVLVPLGLVSSLPPEQVEAVLLHELAHIRRRDYLVNLLQSFAEVIFFFNPAMLWLSSLIREERENCCDDMAVCCTKDKSQFIHALLAFQEYVMNGSNKDTAIAFAGQKRHLLNRVKRIIYNENKKLNAMEKGILIFSIAATGLVGFATIRQSSVHWSLSAVHSPAVTTNADTIPTSQTSRQTDTIPRLMEFNSVNSVSNKEGDSRNRIITAVDKNGKKFKLVEKNDELVEMFVDGKKIPPGELSTYENIIKRIEEEVESREKTMQEKLTKDQAEQGQKIAKLNAERNELLQKLSELDQERARLGSENDNQLWDHEWESAANNKNFDLLLNLKQDSQVRFDSLKNSELTPLLYDKLESLKKMNADNLFQQKLFSENRKDINDNYLDKLLREDFDQQHQTELLNEKPGVLNNPALEQQQYHTYVLIDPIIQDMVEQKIVPKHQDELSFELNNSSFIVNGKKQPIEIQERFRKKYLKKKGDYFKFSRKNGHSSTSINLDSDKPE